MPCFQVLFPYFSTTLLHFGGEYSKAGRNLFSSPGWCKRQRYFKKKRETKNKKQSPITWPTDQFFKHFKPVSSKWCIHQSLQLLTAYFSLLESLCRGIHSFSKNMLVFVAPYWLQRADHKADFKTNTHTCAQKATSTYLSIPFTSLLRVSPALQGFQVG